MKYLFRTESIEKIPKMIIHISSIKTFNTNMVFWSINKNKSFVFLIIFKEYLLYYLFINIDSYDRVFIIYSSIQKKKKKKR